MVGNKMSLADVGLLEPLLWTEEILKEELDQYEAVKVRPLGPIRGLARVEL